MGQDMENVVRECTEGSDDGRFKFPQIVGRLMEAGIERYTADLVRSEKTYYDESGASFVVPFAGSRTPAAKNFAAAAVEAAIRASQADSISYKEFCERVLAAGCVGYIVSITGKRAVYFGRTGESHVELFPRPS